MNTVESARSSVYRLRVALGLFILCTFSCQTYGQLNTLAPRSIGLEVSVPSHLQDGGESSVSLEALIAHGKLLFNANWTEQEGGGRPLTKGTGRPLSDSSQPLTGPRSFNRISAPDANSCAGCHNAPYGLSGGGGDFVTTVFVLGQRFDSITFDPADTLPTRGTVDETGKPTTLQTVADLRATTGMFGSGYLEMLARQMTEELQQIRDTIQLGQTKDLVAKGIRFGKLTLTKEGLWDTSKVEGLGRLSLLSTGSVHPPTLVIRPWHQAGNVVSIREFTNNAYNHHHGIQSTERFGLDTDPDGDGFKNELTRADVTAVTVYQATLQVPGRVIPRDPEVEQAVLLGERLLERMPCPGASAETEGLDLLGAQPFQSTGQSPQRRDPRLESRSFERRPARAAPAAGSFRHRVGRSLHRFQAPQHLRTGRGRAARHEPVAMVEEVQRGELPISNQAPVGRGQRAALLPSWPLHNHAPVGVGAFRRGPRVTESLRGSGAGRAGRRHRVPENAASSSPGHEGSHRG